MARELTRRRRAPSDESAYATTPAAEETAPERPARGRRSAPAAEAPAAESKPKVSKGWGSYTKTAAATKGGDFAPEFKVDKDETVLIKILDEGPFAVYKQHWIERGIGLKKSFNCLKDDEGQGYCPLCDDLDDKPKARAEVNVIDMMQEPDKQEVLVWKVGSGVGDILANAANESRTSPINKSDLYWAVSKEIKNGNTRYQVVPVKARDLKDDWDTEPLTEDDFNLFVEEGYDDDIVYFNSAQDLKDVVKERKQ